MNPLPPRSAGLVGPLSLPPRSVGEARKGERRESEFDVCDPLPGPCMWSGVVLVLLRAWQIVPALGGGARWGAWIVTPVNPGVQPGQLPGPLEPVSRKVGCTGEVGTGE